MKRPRKSDQAEPVFSVEITARAERDLAMIYNRINASESTRAQRWFRGLGRAVLGLERLPERCPTAEENRRLRCLLFGHKPHVYRVLFKIVDRQKRVQVLHIRHGAMKRFTPDDLK